MPFLMVCLVGLLVSVQASPVSPPMVSGQVRLPDGSPVAGAQVVLFDVADLRRGAGGAKPPRTRREQFALPLAASTAFVLPSSGWAGAELSESIQSFDAHSLSTGGDLHRCGWRCSMCLGSAGGDAGGWPTSRGGVCGAVGWHGCGGWCCRLGGVFLPFDGG